MIKQCTTAEQPGWLDLRMALWPECPPAEHVAEMASIATTPQRFIAFLAYEPSGNPIGLAEAAIRTDYVNGTSTSPVAFLEGLYVAPEYRAQGIARSLVAKVEQWASTSGCHELASDALIENTRSHAMHRRLGFEETERVVFFVKAIRP